VDILVIVCLCMCEFVWLRISLLRTKWRYILHGGSSASKAGNDTFGETLLPQKPKIGQG